MKCLKIAVSIIENDSLVRKIFAQWILESAEFCLLSCYATAQSAMAHLPDECPEIVLIDINLSGQNGVHCVEFLKPQMPGTEFVMLTVFEDMEHIFEALAVGAAGYLVKRAQKEEFFASMKQIHEGGAPMTSYFARRVLKVFQSSVPKQSSEPQGLSPRERELLSLLARGFTYQEISETFGISMSTVNTHVNRIYQKLHMRSRREAVAIYGKIPQGTPSVDLLSAK